MIPWDHGWWSPNEWHAHLATFQQWATCLDTPQLFPDSFSKAMAISATRCSPWYMVEAESKQPSHDSTFPTFRPSRQCYGYGLPRWSPPTPKASTHQTRHCLWSASKRFAPTVMQRTSKDHSMLGHGQILTMKNDNVSQKKKTWSKLEICWSWCFETSIFSIVFLHVLLLLFFLFAELHEPVSQAKPDGWSWKAGRSVFCIDSNEIIRKYTYDYMYSMYVYTVYIYTYINDTLYVLIVLTYVDLFIIIQKKKHM